MSTLLVNNIKSFSGDTVAISGSNISISGNTTLGDGVGTDITTVKGKIILTSSLTRIILSSSGEVKLTSPSDGHTGVTHGFSLTNQDQDFKGSITASSGIKTGGNSSLGNGSGDKHTITGKSTFVGNITASGNISASGTIFAGGVSALSGLISGSGVAALTTVSGPTGSFGLIQSLANGLRLRILGDTILGNGLNDTHTFNGHITSSGNISSSGTLFNSAVESLATIKAPEISGSVGVTGPTGSFGLINNFGGNDLKIKAADDIVLDPSDNIEIRANGVLKSTFFGEGKLRVGSTNSVAPFNVLHVGGVSGGSVFCGPLTSSAIILSGSVRNISNANLVTANGFDTNKGTANSQDLNTSAVYNVQGRKVEVRAITAAQINDGAFAQFKLANNSIAIDSIVLGSFTGGTGGPITGSILTAATITAGTASVQIHNETGGAIAADSPFTASFIVL